MDSSLIAWAKAVKRRGYGVPPLWYVTDATRAADPLPVIARLPPGLSGVLFRHDGAPGRAALAAKVARLCRARRLVLVVAGGAGLPAGAKAGAHWRGGRRGRARRGGLASASAHSPREMARARRAGADLVFISPVFPTRSHPGAAVLGPRGWRNLARLAGPVKLLALGGIETARQLRGLGPGCAGIAAIGAFH